MAGRNGNTEECRIGVGSYSKGPDSKTLCDRIATSLILKLTEKNDKPTSSMQIPYWPKKNIPEDMSDTEEPEQGDEKSTKSLPSQILRKIPRAFEKSDTLYKKQMAKKAIRRARIDQEKPKNTCQRIT